jgi:hypothetical protein
MSWRVEECAAATGVSTLANHRGGAGRGAPVGERAARRDAARPGGGADAHAAARGARGAAALCRSAARRALLWLARGAASLAIKFESLLVAGDSAIACTVLMSTICEHVVCVDDWWARYAPTVHPSTAGVAGERLPQVSAHVRMLLSEDAAFVLQECDEMPLSAVEEGAIDCAAALNGSLRQSILWLEQLYGGRGRPFGGGHPLLIVLWRRLAAALRATVERDGDEPEHERRRA